HRVARDAGVVDQDVDRAELALDALDAVDARRGVRHVPAIDRDAGLLVEALGGFLVAGVIGGDLVAGGVERLGDRAADAARAASNDRDLRHRCPLALILLVPIFAGI